MLGIFPSDPGLHANPWFLVAGLRDQPAQAVEMTNVVQIRDLKTREERKAERRARQADTAPCEMPPEIYAAPDKDPA